MKQGKFHVQVRDNSSKNEYIVKVFKFQDDYLGEWLKFSEKFYPYLIESESISSVDAGVSKAITRKTSIEYTLGFIDSLKSLNHEVTVSLA
jgi:hypothetical protein